MTPDFPFGSYDLVLMKDLLEMADADPALTGFVYPDDVSRARLPIVSQGQLCGFATPRQDPDGVWRMGAIYIHPKFRKKGLASRAIASFMRDRRGRAFIEDTNIASQAAYRAAGFAPSRRDEESGGCWWEVGAECSP